MDFFSNLFSKKHDEKQDEKQQIPRGQSGNLQDEEDEGSFFGAFFTMLSFEGDHKSDGGGTNTGTEKPQPQAKNSVFGVGSIGEVPLKYDIPHIIAACLEYLYLTNAQEEEGLFRVGGNVQTIRQLKMELALVGDDIVIDPALVPSPHDVTGLLKSFFRELGEPLLSNDLYEEFMNSAQNLKKPEELRVKLKSLVSELTPLNKITLKRILYFLRYVASFKTQNKMDITNLATTLGPTLLTKFDDINRLGVSIKLMVVFLENFESIFGHYDKLSFEKDIPVLLQVTPVPVEESSSIAHLEQPFVKPQGFFRKTLAKFDRKSFHEKVVSGKFERRLTRKRTEVGLPLTTTSSSLLTTNGTVGVATDDADDVTFVPPANLERKVSLDSN